MKGLKLIRRLALAGLLRYHPMDGAPVLRLEGGRFRFYWTVPAIRREGEVTYHFPNPEAICRAYIAAKEFLNLKGR